MSNIRIGMLEFGYRAGKTSMETLEEVTQYAVRADEMGCSRFWIGEHHRPFKTNAWSNPDILLTLLAGMTERIRIGTAGSLISVYSPYAIAMNFKLLNSLFGNRIDLGLAKGVPDSDYAIQLLNKELNRTNWTPYFGKNLELIHDLFHREEELFERDIVLPPYGGMPPQLWYLSGSFKSLAHIVKYKTNFCKSLFHGNADNEMDASVLDHYRGEYAERHGMLPEVNLALSVRIIKDTDSAARTAVTGTGKEAFKTLVISVEELYDTVHLYHETYDINEFIIHDASTDSSEKMEHLSMLKELFLITNEANEEV
ncbi:LLM class flavin-dependent oxidoreductase [Chitinophaga sp. S165]|uniref:LLM class flavin-dependent oxidoreductase n=1 Tax=Chitinophaga sp. S165 TaxID=2135462 RepID=UPI000D71AC48|nr:LLM class flavin-dependent oxidoreductase [Chitinophaga sp. S165]PWV51818.1 luciferase-like monooxygenase [Chitinophaga sp. S165]